MAQFILVIGTVMSVASIASAWELWHLGDPAWQTVLFTTLVFTQLAVALEARSEQESLFRIGLFRNPLMVLAVLLTVSLQLVVVYLPPAQRVFDTVAMPAGDLALASGLAVLVLLLVEAWKAVRRSRERG